MLLQSNLLEAYLATDFDDNNAINERYSVLYISYFDHFLNEQEYITAELVCYADCKDDQAKQKQYKVIENKFIAFYKALYELAREDVMVSIKGDLIPINSYNKYSKFIINAIRENPLCCFLYPSLGFFSLTGYDLTHNLYILKQPVASALRAEQQIIKLAKQQGLNSIG